MEVLLIFIFKWERGFAFLRPGSPLLNDVIVIHSLQDISYHCCIEVAGERRHIISCLIPLFNTDTGKVSSTVEPLILMSSTGPTPAGKAYEDGRRAGHCVMYHSGTYPFGAVGPVEFLWQPVNDVVRVTKLWLTVSPTIHDEVMRELTVAVEMFTGGCCDNRLENGEKSQGSKVTVTSLRDEFVRFRLVGPRSHAIVMETIKPVTDDDKKPTTASELAEKPSSYTQPDLSHVPIPIPWWNEDPNLPAHTELLGNMLENLRNARDPGEFPVGTVVGVVVQDPRLFTPSKKSDMVSEFYPKRKVDWWGGGGGGGGGRGERGGEGERERKRRKELEGEEVEGVVEEMDEEDEEEEGEVEEMAVLVEEEEEEKKERAEVVEEVAVLEEKEEEEREVEGRGGGKAEEKEDQTDTQQTYEPSTATGEGAIAAVSHGQTLTNLSLPNLAYSPLWCSRVRNIVSKSKIPEHILNDVRSSVLVGTNELRLGNKSPRIPIMLVRQSYASSHVDGVLQLGEKGRSYRTGGLKSVTTSSVEGWDLLLPREWAMAFWVAMVYRGARACGRAALQKCHLETGCPFFPDDYLDTRAGRVEGERRGREAEAKYRRYPPDKRRNYGKLSIQNPFRSPWGELVREWKEKRSRLICEVPVEEDAGVCSPDEDGGKMEGERSVGGGTGRGTSNRLEGEVADGGSQMGEEVGSEPPTKRIKLADNGNDTIAPEAPISKDFYVLRSKSSLLSLSRFFNALAVMKQAHNSSTTSGETKILESAKNQSFHSLVKDFEIDKLLQEHSQALIGVSFEMLHRGNATSNDIISVPTLSDLKNLGDSGKNFDGPEETLCSRGLTVVEGDVVCVGVSGVSRGKLAEVKRERKRKKKEKEEEITAIDGDEKRKSTCK